MTIIPRENVRACVERAMLLDGLDCEAAVLAVAAALALPVEAVREVVEPAQEAAC